jgi:hypothetical protein
MLTEAGSVVEPYRFIAVLVPTLEKFWLRFRIQIWNRMQTIYGSDKKIF